MRLAGLQELRLGVSWLSAKVMGGGGGEVARVPHPSEDSQGLRMCWLTGFQKEGGRSLWLGTNLGSELAQSSFCCIRLVRVSHQPSLKGRERDSTS